MVAGTTTAQHGSAPAMHGNPLQHSVALWWHRHGRPGNGFCSFLRPPGERERYTAGGLIGADGSIPAAARDLLHVAMGELARRLKARADPIWTAPLPGAADANDNPGIPAGYTYLLQFMAHDLVDTQFAATFAVGPRRPQGSGFEATFGNGRAAPLMLDTLYGGGPDECPGPYAVGTHYTFSNGVQPRTHLRLGNLRPLRAGFGGVLDEPWPSPTTYCPFRDLARTPARACDSGAAGTPGWLTDTLVADPRNDSHALISQLTVLFHLLHNAVVDLLLPESRRDTRFLEDVFRRTLCARYVVTLIYRNIIAKDVLPRLLDPQVLAAYQRRGGLQLGATDGIALEFAAGAFRFGHAMIRERYVVNAHHLPPGKPVDIGRGLRQTARFPPGADGDPNVPVDVQWTVDWAHFFGAPAGGGVVNLSRRIGPDYNPSLSDQFIFPGKVDGEADRGLADRDMLSASYAGLWSVPPLMAEVRKRLAAQGFPEVVPDFAAWREPLREWLADAIGSDESTRSMREAIAADPPLPFFVLFEAAHELIGDGPRQPRTGSGRRFAGSGGRTLGPLGSVIVAETLYGALRSQPFGFDEAETPLNLGIELVANGLIGSVSELAAVTRHPIESMGDLLAFLDRHKAFKSASAVRPDGSLV